MTASRDLSVADGLALTTAWVRLRLASSHADAPENSGMLQSSDLVASYASQGSRSDR